MTDTNFQDLLQKHDQQLALLHRDFNTISDVQKEQAKIQNAQGETLGRIEILVGKLAEKKDFDLKAYLPTLATLATLIGAIGFCIVYISTNAMTPELDKLSDRVDEKFNAVGARFRRYSDRYHKLERRLTIIEIQRRGPQIVMRNNKADRTN